MTDLRAFFLLDPEVIFLNHGSFGATPRPVMESYRDWQARMERQPVLFLGRELDHLLLEARAALGEYLRADAADLVFIPNATHGANIIARSLNLSAGDDVLSTDHEYGACDYAWEFTSGRAGFRYIRQQISLPVHSEDEIVDQLWRGVTPRTRVIYLSHITSPTALRLPVERICAKARRQGILTVIDAAHSPGQIPMDLQRLGADILFGNCHKWMLAPKGAGFLYVRKEMQSIVQPLVVSWGYHATAQNTTGSRFVDLLQWTGTRDASAYLAIPAAIRFMRDHDWDAVRKRCHALLQSTVQRVCELFEMPALYPLDSDFYSQMGIAPLPNCNLPLLKTRLYDEYRIEIPLIQWQDRQFIRISVQGYNTREELDALLQALGKLMLEVRQ